MDLDELCKIVQNWTNRVPLIVTGSGASIPFWLPSMNQLGEYLKDNIVFSYHRDSDQFDKFKSYLAKYKDLEQALSKFSSLRSTVLSEIILKTWSLVNEKDLSFYKKLLKKEIDFPLRELIQYFLDTADRKVTVITTNYDRQVEYAASLVNAYINTGFMQTYLGGFNPEIIKINLAKQHGYNGQVNIWKVHGSLDWFKSDDNKLTQIPLSREIDEGFIPSIVTPGIGKYLETHKDPFRTIFSEADSAIKNANGFICIGYGFNDEHVQPYLIDEVQRNKPIIVLTKALTYLTKKAIIENNCKHYLLFEQDGVDTKVFSSVKGEFNLPNSAYWQLGEFLKLIKE